MNHQTKNILERAKDRIARNGEGQWTQSQLYDIYELIDIIGEAIEKETVCNKESIYWR